MNILKLFIIIIEAGHSLIDWRKQNEFEENVEKIKKDPVAYARNKFGRVRDNSKDDGKLQDSDTDS